MVPPVQFSYRCPKCGNTFAADGDGAAGSGCPGCRESPGAGWYLKVRGEIVGPVSFESLPDQINASAVLVRQSGESDWTPVTAVLPAMPAIGTNAPFPPDSSLADEAIRSPARRLIWPVVAAAFAVIVLASGWVYHRVTLARVVESGEETGTSSRGLSRSQDRSGGKAKAERTGQSVAELEKRLAASEYRRHLLAEVTARQSRQLAAQIQDLKAATTRSRRFRRFRGEVFPPDEDASKTLMDGFRRKLALKWAAVLAKRRDAAAEQAFLAAEIKRITGAPARPPLQVPDLHLLRQNGVTYRTQYNVFYPYEHRELTLFMEYGTADEIVKFAAHAGLEIPAAARPADFASAIRKLPGK